MLRKRVLTSLVAVPVVILTVWFDGWFSVLAAFFAVFATWEFYRITGVSRFKPLAVFGVIWALLFVLSPHYGDWLGSDITPPLPLPILLLTTAAILSLVWLAFTPMKKGSLIVRVWMLSGMLYVGWLLSYLVALRLEASAAWLYLAVLTTFASDTAAYCIGKAFGRHKMAPRISPGKTWEGAFGGLLGAVIIALLFTLDTPLQLPIGYGEAVLLGLLISVFGQLGDLVESMLKRSAGVKESGVMMPGHGGLLDRLDSVIFAGVVVYLYYVFVVI